MEPLPPVHLEGSVPDVVPCARAMHYRVVNAELGEDSVEVPLHRPHRDNPSCCGCAEHHPLGEAADSIRCAMPTGSPMVV
jgi:hypothetical protein